VVKTKGNPYPPGRIYQYRLRGFLQQASVCDIKALDYFYQNVCRSEEHIRTISISIGMISEDEKVPDKTLRTKSTYTQSKTIKRTSVDSSQDKHNKTPFSFRETRG